MLKSAVDALPEVYQPIYGHSEMNLDISRDCQDRLETIKKVSDCISKKLGRPLNILDIGCAQGFMSLSLAEGGHKVTGIDFLDANINVCKALLEENPESKVVFRHTDLEDFVPGINKDEYDLVLCLSVIHHVAHQDGFDFAQDLIKQLSEKTAAGIYELALKSEPLYWNDNLPEDHREFLTDYDYIYRLSETSTHLSVIKRPLIYASNRFAYMPATDEAQEFCARIIKAKRNPHNVADNAYYGTRRYCFTEDGHFIKLTQLQMPEHPELEEINRNESERETDILSRFKENDFFPELIRYDVKPDEAHLVRKNLEGVLLSEAINDGTEYDPQKIVAELLDFCVFLEENGLYHSDLRVWNMLLTPVGDVRVIDYGAITDEYTDVFSPHDPLLSLLIVIWEIFNKTIRSTSVLRYIDSRSIIRTLGNSETCREIFSLRSDEKPFARIKGIFSKTGFDSQKSNKGRSLETSILMTEGELSETLDTSLRENRNRWEEIRSATVRIENLEDENISRYKELQLADHRLSVLDKENVNRHEEIVSLFNKTEEIDRLNEGQSRLENRQDELLLKSSEIDNEQLALRNQMDQLVLLKNQMDQLVLLKNQMDQLVLEKVNLEARIFELENSKPRRIYVGLCSGIRSFFSIFKKSKEDDETERTITDTSEMHIVVDMLPYRGDGANGGVVPALLETLKGMRNKGVEITLLTSRSNYLSLAFLDEYGISRINVEGGEPIAEEVETSIPEAEQHENLSNNTNAESEGSEIPLRQTGKPRVNSRYFVLKIKAFLLAICPEFLYKWLKKHKEGIRNILWSLRHPVQGILKPVARVLLPHGVINSHRRKWAERNVVKYSGVELSKIVGKTVDLLFCPFSAVNFYDPNVPVVSQVNDIQHRYFPFNFSEEEYNTRENFYRNLINVSPYILAISDYTLKSFSEMYDYPESKMEVVYLATQDRLSGFSEEECADELKELNLEPHKFLYYPANFWPHKNHRSLLVAFRMYLEMHPESDLQLIFSGFRASEDIDPETVARQMGMEGKVRALGYVSDVQVAALMRNCRLMIYPSLFEGFGLPIPEALQSDTTIVCSNVTSLPEVAGDCAFYFDPYDPRKICDTIEYVFKHPEEEVQKKSLYSEQLKKFSEQEYLEHMLDVFKRLSGK